MIFTGFIFAKSLNTFNNYYLLKKTKKKNEKIIFVSKGNHVLVKEFTSYYNVQVSHISNNIIYGIITEIINKSFFGCNIGTHIAFSYGDIIEVLN